MTDPQDLRWGDGFSWSDDSDKPIHQMQYRVMDTEPDTIDFGFPTPPTLQALTLQGQANNYIATMPANLSSFFALDIKLDYEDLLRRLRLISSNNLTDEETTWISEFEKILKRIVEG